MTHLFPPRSPSDRTSSHRSSSIPDSIEASVGVLSRAGAAIDDLIERNRAITDAAMRSIEHFRLQTKEVRAENEKLIAEVEALRNEVDTVRAEREAMRTAAEALQADLEGEIEKQRRELEQAHKLIQHFNLQVGKLLGGADLKLAETHDSLGTD